MENELGHCLIILTEQAWSITHSVLLIWYKGFSGFIRPFRYLFQHRLPKVGIIDFVIPICAACIFWVCEYLSTIYWELQLKKKILPEYVILIIRSVIILYPVKMKWQDHSLIVVVFHVLIHGNVFTVIYHRWDPSQCAVTTSTSTNSCKFSCYSTYWVLPFSLVLNSIYLLSRVSLHL